MLFTKKRTIFLTVFVLILSLVVVGYFLLANINSNTAQMRTIEIKKSNIDYQAIFDEFDSAEIVIDESTNSINFSGSQKVDSSIFEQFDLVNVSSEVEKMLDIHYEFDYCADTNEFYLSILADKNEGTIIDKWVGIPFTTEQGETDIAFDTEDGIIFLSDLEESGVLNNCGWFSKLFKKIAIVATAVAVVTGVTSVISSRVYSTTEEKVEAARKELVKRRPNDTIIYRMGSNSYYNLTPRPTDTNGLSFFSDVYLGKCVITTRELVNATGTLKATGSGHVLVSPVAGDIAAWIATKNNADSNPHPYSVTLQQICIRAY